MSKELDQLLCNHSASGLNAWLPDPYEYNFHCYKCGIHIVGSKEKRTFIEHVKSVNDWLREE